MRLLALSLQAQNIILISVTCFCILVLVFMLVYRKRKGIQAKNDAKKEESGDNKDLLNDIIAAHKQKEAEKKETPEAPQAEVELKETGNNDDNKNA